MACANCKQCGRQFYCEPYQLRRGRQFCSVSCGLRFNWHGRERLTRERVCPSCNTKFLFTRGMHWAKKYCNSACFRKRNGAIVAQCLVCTVENNGGFRRGLCSRCYDSFRRYGRNMELVKLKRTWNHLRFIIAGKWRKQYGHTQHV